ncbi:hypothetical protein GCM10009789_37800 [Kribbella sancticallisti]|uniref:Uncharacterized protein n=1 Tax=Kribbella sancticallisti TaxID=460087 RepID=A0ABP4PHC8_9ACTN
MLGWLLLIVCWVVVASVGGLVWFVFSVYGDHLFPDYEVDSGWSAAATLLRSALKIVGWVLVIIAVFRTPLDASIINRSFVDTAMQALALWPAAAASTALTILVAMMLPGASGKLFRSLPVIGSLVLSGVAMGLLFYLSNAVVQDGGFGAVIFLGGYGPLMLVSVLFLAASIGWGFFAGIIHPRAGGVRTVLFALGLVATVAFIDSHGPLQVPMPGVEPVTVSLVASALGGWGALALFVAGVLGIVLPVDTDEAAS